MPVDSAIYSMIRPTERQAGPLDNYGAMMQLMALGDQSQLSALHRQKLSSDLQEEDAFKSRIADWVKAGGQGQLPADAYAASPSRAATFDKTRTEGETARANLEKTKTETHGLQVKQLRDQLAAVRDDSGLAALRESALKLYGPKVQIPGSVMEPGFEDWRKSQLMDADKFIAQSKPQMEKVDDGKTIRMIDVNAFTNPAVKGMTFNKQLTPGEAAQQNQPIWDEARGVFVIRPAPGARPAPAAAPGAAPGAAAAPAPGAPAVIRPAGLPPKPTDVHTLRNEFNMLPEVKSYKDIVPVVEAARSAPDTRAGDIQLGYAVGKILDPNSVVREGEIKMVGDAAPIYQKYKGEFDSIANGTGRFTPETRKQLVAMLDNAVNQRETAYKQAETTYRGIADKNGIPVDQVIITPMKRTGGESKPAGPKMFDAMPDPSKYNGRRLQSDDGTVYTSNGKSWVRERRAQQ